MFYEIQVSQKHITPTGFLCFIVSIIIIPALLVNIEMKIPLKIDTFLSRCYNETVFRAGPAQRKEAFSMSHPFSRSQLLLNKDGMQTLRDSRVILFGVGGVGSYTAEALARSGIGALTLVDSDVVSETNLNRQLIALHSTVGKLKVDVMRERISDISPDCDVKTFPEFVTRDNLGQFDLASYDYIVDAIDTVSAKIALAETAYHLNVPILSCMGAGNKLDPTRFVVTDLFETSVCPLARVMRQELRKRNIPKLKVVYSTEEARKPFADPDSTEDLPSGKRQTPGSVPFVPSVAGLIAAGEVVRDLLKIER